MLWIYNIGIAMYGILLRFVALFNTKAKFFVKGRQHIFEQLAQKVNPHDQPIWFHFASLGEFEQGRPVLEAIKAAHPTQAIVVTFFSPSGYEIRKNYNLASVFYLPLDTAANARKFVEIVNPKLAIFTKYEFWYHYFNELHRKAVPLYLISGIFRPGQVFFKPYGGFYRGILKHVSHFFVQNEESVMLLKNIGLNNVSLSGDTRFDRVYENAQHPKKIAEVASFCGSSPVFIAGSTWTDDEKLLPALVQHYPDWKIIIAPHEIGTSHLAEIEQLFPNAVRFSALGTAVPTAQVLLIDNIGMLSSLYQYAQIAYIGGGFGAGIHNTLEATAFGLPVIFGPKFEKFQEAKDLLALGAAKSISNTAELLAAFDHFNTNATAADLAKDYVNAKKGATAQILKQLNL